MLRPGNAGSSTAAGHEAVIASALTQVGLGPRPERRVLVRTDGAGGTKAVLAALERRRVSYSVGSRPAWRHAPDLQADPSPGVGTGLQHRRGPTRAGRTWPS